MEPHGCFFWLNFTSVLFYSCEISRSYHTFSLPNHSLFTNSSGLTFPPAASDAQLPPVNSFSKPTISSLRLAQRTLDKKVCKMILIKTHLVIIIFRKYCLFKWTTFPRYAFPFLPLSLSLSLSIEFFTIHSSLSHPRESHLEWTSLSYLLLFSNSLSCLLARSSFRIAILTANFARSPFILSRVFIHSHPNSFTLWLKGPADRAL